MGTSFCLMQHLGYYQLNINNCLAEGTQISPSVFDRKLRIAHAEKVYNIVHVIHTEPESVAKGVQCMWESNK